jgi:hypothetical protein
MVQLSGNIHFWQAVLLRGRPSQTDFCSGINPLMPDYQTRPPTDYQEAVVTDCTAVAAHSNGTEINRRATPARRPGCTKIGFLLAAICGRIRASE